MSTCKSCGAEILWAVGDPSGKSIPIDPNPTPNGNLILYTNDSGKQIATFIDSSDEWEEDRYTSHFVTCPQADAWRRKK